MKRRIGVVVASTAGLMLLLAGCSSAPELAGNWRSTGPTEVVSFYDNGQCTGMMNVDIGGPMMCSLSDDEQDGYFTLFVQQGENNVSYLLQPDGNDHVTIYDSLKNQLYDLNRA